MTENQASENNDQKEAELLLKIWEKAVDTQMHFNEMSVKSRQLGFGFVAAALGLAAFLLSRSADFSIAIPTPCGRIIFHASVMLILVSIVAIIAIRMLDLGVYHRMLRGAVAFGRDLEKNRMNKLIRLEKGMTEAIRHFSQFSDAATNEDGQRFSYTGIASSTAEAKIRRFYNFVICMLVLAAFLLFLVTNFGIFQAAKPTLPA